MKLLMYTLSLLLLSIINLSFSQTENNDLPDVMVETLDSQNTSLQSFIQNEQPTLLCMWTTWSSASIRQLDDIQRLTDSWKEEGLDVKIIAINMDKASKTLDVNSMVSTKGWDFQILMDKKENFKNAMNITSIPYSVIVKNGKVEYLHSGFERGDIDEFKEKLVNLSK